MPTVSIRTASASDAPSVAAVYVASWNAGFGDRLGHRDLDGTAVGRWAADLIGANDAWFVAELGDTVAGFAGLGPSRDPVDGTLGELDTIAVEPGYWRRGIGRALMDRCLSVLAGRYAEAIVWTLAGYEPALRFYGATGWAPDGGSRAGGTQVSLRTRLR